MENQAQKKGNFFNNPLLKTKVKSANVKFPEMLIGYLIGPFGGLLLSGILGAQITTYWKYVLFAQEYANVGSEIYQLVTTFTTLLPLLSAILIVAGNLIVGQLIEKTRTPAGKARPWVLLSSVFLGLSCVLMFIAPTDNTLAKIVLQAISYNLYYAVAYPMYNTANSTMIPVSTRNSKQRSMLASVTNIAGLGVMGAGSMIFPALISLVLHYNSVAWTAAFVAIGVISFLLPVLQYYFTRERVTEETLALPAANSKKISVGAQLKAIASEKFWWIIIIFYLVFQFSGALKNASMYDFCYTVIGGVLGAENAGIMQTILGIIGAVPMALAIGVIWPLANKFNKQIVVLGGMLLGVVGGVIAGVGSTNIVAVAIGVALKCFGSAPACYMILAMISDMLDHLESKVGFRCDGLTMSIYSAIMIAATPVCVGIYNGLMGVAGFSSASAVQNEMVNTVVAVSYIWVETIAYALCAVLLIFFAVEKNLKEDQKKIRARQKAEAQAAGIEWVEPEEKLRLEEEQAERESELARIEESKAYCARKGLNFEEIEAQYQAKLAKKKKK